MKQSQSANASDVASEDRKTVFIDELCRCVLSMDLVPGAALDELAMVKEFGLSRPPVREVFRKIEHTIEHQARSAAGLASYLGRRKEGTDHCPRLIREVITLCHH